MMAAGTAGAPARIHDIPAAAPFLDVLARGVLGRVSRQTPEDPLALARVTILVPTRRAVRGLRESFLRASGGRALLLPRILPLGDLEEESSVFAEPGGEDGGFATGWIGGPPSDEEPAVIGGLRRQLLLARMVQRFEGLSWERTPDAGQAASLAAELARLLDQMETERIGPEALVAIAPQEAFLAHHWQEILRFLSLITEAWPRVLEEEGAIGPARYRNHLLERTAEHWAARPPSFPVIAAGSTGSIPATADLLRCIARLPHGCVVLPGLDREIAAEAWDGLGGPSGEASGKAAEETPEETHPQYGLARLLRHLGVERGDVTPFADAWPAPEAAGPPSPLPADALARTRLVSGAMNTLPRLPRDLDPARAMERVSWLEAPTPAEEAAAIAVMMRDALERGETAALVTPDRALARRVALRLERWSLEIDDSAGRPLAATPPALFLRTLAEMVIGALAPVALLSCLKHPLAAGGGNPARFRARLRSLEIQALRGPRPASGIAGLRDRIEERRAHLGPQESRESERRALMESLAFLDALERGLAPLSGAVAQGKPLPLRDWLQALLETAEALAATDSESGADRLWQGEDGDALSAFFQELDQAAEGFPPLPAGELLPLLNELMSGRVVRPRYGRHPRLFLWGPLEARLQQADLMILGSLNEGTWPADPGSDPWMSRDQRARLGLPLPERRIGQAAHDFTQAFAAPRVALTRAQRFGSSPAVPSRWLMRLATALPEPVLEAARARGRDWLRHVACLDHPAKGQWQNPIRPAPKPPVAARPRRLSVTDVETWQVNPYAIFAKHILKLRPLDPIEARPGVAERGTFLHRVLELFIARYRDTLPPGGEAGIRAALLAIGEEVNADQRLPPEVHAFWWPRFCRVADWLSRQEPEQRKQALPLRTEIRGELLLDFETGPFRVVGVADRIERCVEGGLSVIDYKTGSIPDKKVQETGFAPQLPLLGAIAEAGGFPGLEKARVSALSFWKLSGGRPAGEISSFRVASAEAMAEALEGLRTLVERFDQEDMPYAPHVAPSPRLRYDDYAHLARIKAWSSQPGEDSE